MIKWSGPNRTAVITGGASGIGLATARRLLAMHMNVVIADRAQTALDDAARTLLGEGDHRSRLVVQPCDVAVAKDLGDLRDVALDRFGAVHFLMNNAGASLPTGAPWENLDAWKKQLDINLWGVIHGCQAFIPAMIARGEQGIIVNTGSKQGITKPPGNYAYNLSKAGVLAYTECLEHALRQLPERNLSAHLLVPGFTYTGMIAKHVPEKPPGAWTAEQVTDFLIAAVERDEFYILCPDNDVTREMDERRIQWGAEDIIKNRPALSRWHPDYADAFAEFMKR